MNQQLNSYIFVVHLMLNLSEGIHPESTGKVLVLGNAARTKGF